MPRTIHTMTVERLLRHLKDQDPKALVVFAYDYGDRCHTQAVSGIRTVDTAEVVESAYSGSGLALASNSGDDEDSQVYVVIQGDTR